MLHVHNFKKERSFEGVYYFCDITSAFLSALALFILSFAIYYNDTITFSEITCYLACPLMYVGMLVIRGYYKDRRNELIDDLMSSRRDSIVFVVLTICYPLFLTCFLLVTCYTDETVFSEFEAMYKTTVYCPVRFGMLGGNLFITVMFVFVFCVRTFVDHVNIAFLKKSLEMN